LNDEPQYSRGVVVAAAGWLATGLLLVVAWIAWAAGDAENVHLAVLIAESACVLSAVAAVLHLRCYAARMCRLIRVANGLERPRGEVREFTPRDR
jgi:hypothetical protein